MWKKPWFTQLIVFVMLLGGIPVYGSSYTVLDNILKKIIDYETEPLASIGWRESALLPMSYSDASTDGAYLGEAMKGDYLAPNSYSTWTMYQQGSICGAGADSALGAVLTSGQPNISVSPKNHNFGIVTRGGSSESQTFTLSNTGTTDLVLGTITISGTNASEFSIQNDYCSGHSIVPSERCMVDVIFSPTSSGSKHAQLSIPSNDPEIPTLDVALIGTGIDDLLGDYETGDEEFKRLEIGDSIVYFYQRMIDDAIVERDFIVYQFDRATGELIDRKVHWLSDLPEHITIDITKEQAESMVMGEVQFTEMYIISPDSDVFTLDPTAENPCWVVRSIDDGNTIVTIIDAVTGEMLGHGVPPPEGGFTLSGPWYSNPCSGAWTAWYQNAENWFNTMGYPTEAVEWPTETQVKSHIQNPDTSLFYELAHGSSTYFASGCIGGTDYEYTYSSEIGRCTPFLGHF